MKTIIANITSFDGISPDAEHYYCKYEEIEEQALLLHRIFEYDKIYVYGNKELRYFPTLEEAEELAKKDGSSINWTQEYVEEGTIRFPSIHAITMALRKQFSDANIIVAKNGSVKEYNYSSLHEEFYTAFDELTKEQQDTVVEFFFGNNLERYNDSAKRHELLCLVFRTKQEEIFSLVIQAVTGNKGLEELKKRLKK